MARLAGINIPNEKRIEIALRYIQGIGPTLSKQVLVKAKVSPDVRVKNMTEEEINRIQKVLEEYVIEGDLRRRVEENVKRLKAIKSYRGFRHSMGLPVRGQRTRSNARTKRGRRMTVGTIRKDIVSRIGAKEETPVQEGSAKAKE